MATKPKRKHGLSRLERLLESSIRQELAIKGLRDSLMTLSLRVALLERGDDHWNCRTLGGVGFDMDTH
jgi:hypothetical protein